MEPWLGKVKPMAQLLFKSFFGGEVPVPEWDQVLTRGATPEVLKRQVKD